MQFTSIDTIVTSLLLRRGYSMHWYLLFMKYATDCVRDLSYRTLGFVKTEMVQADEFGRVPFPADYERWLRVGIVNGQHVQPLVQDSGLNRALLTDDSGLPVQYPQNRSASYQGPYSWIGAWIHKVNDFNESLGGIYGYGAGYERDTFIEVPERNCLQLKQELAGQWVVLDYLPTVNNPDNLCMVPAVAQSTIEQYCVWQLKEHARHYGKGEAKDEERMFWAQERMLRAQLRPLTADDYLRLFRRGYHSTPKS